MTTLDTDIFNNQHSLETLSLGSNAIAHIKTVTFRGLINLKNLWLYNNQITILHTGIFDELWTLEKLELSRNNITYIENGTFAYLSNCTFIDLEGNNLFTLPEGVFKGLSHGIHIIFDVNPWHCDCNLRWLQHLLNAGHVNAGNRFGHYSSIACNTPRAHASKQLLAISESDLVGLCLPDIQTWMISLKVA